MSEDSEGEDEYSSGQDFGIEEEDEFRPTKRSRASKHSYGRKYTSNRVSTAFHLRHTR